MKTYKLYMIRHGLTEYNLDGRYCGTLDPPLCEEGVNQLYELMEQYDYPYVDEVYASPLLRARQTAEILFPGCDYTAVENLREASFGPFEGKTMAQLRDDPEIAKWIVPGSEYAPAGVEPSKAFYVRCRMGIIQIVDDMMRRGVTNAAVVTHAGVISTVLAALAYPKLSQYDWNCEAGCGFMLRADPSLFIREPVLEYFGDIPSEALPHDEEDPYDDMY